MQPGAVPQPAAPPNPATGPAAGSTGAAAMAPVITESDGRFLIRDLPPGSYRLTAARNGYSKQEYGQRSSRGPGTAITLQAGQNMKDIVFRLTPAGTISGRVTDSTGEPLAGITVQLLRSTYAANGRRTFQNVVNDRTNDLGEYRLYWVTPGLYYLNANPSGTYLQTLVQAQLNTATTAARAQDNSANANATSAMLESLLGLNANEVVEPGFALTYYPGTTDASRAAPISVQAGAELRALDISLVKQRTFRVQGRVFDARIGQQPQTAIVQMAARDSLGTAPPMNARGYDPATGAFEFRDVPAGDYMVVAVVQAVTGPAPGVAIGLGSASVSTDIENMVVTVRPGVSLPGEVTLEGSVALSTLPNFDRMRVRLIPASEAVVNASQPPTMKPDGTFVMENVSSGEYRVGLVGLPPNIYIKEARFGGTNLLQETMTIDGPVSGSMQIVLSPNAGQIGGTLLDRDSKPVPATQVVLVPERQRDRRELFKSATTDPNGRFTISGVPPGDYKLFAWDEIDQFAFNDPEILRQYELQAKAVKVSELGRETVEVKIIPAQ